MGRGPAYFSSLVWTIIFSVLSRCEVKTRARVELTWESWISLIRFAPQFLAEERRFRMFRQQIFDMFDR